MPTWTDIITGGPDTANPNWSAMKPLPSGDALDLIGPISWQAPSGVSPHECLLADIQSTGETMLTNIADTPNSNRIAQRNIEIGGVCGWTLKNGTQASTIGVTFTATDGLGNSYVLQSGDQATVTFDDANGALLSGWNSHDHTGCTLTPGTGNVTVTLLSGFGQCTVQGANIAGNATSNVTSTVVPAQFSGTTINLGIATFFSNGGTLPPSPTNGATCSGTAQNGGPR
jgi:hypothetical protein